MTLATLIGFLGAGCILAAYFLVNSGKVADNSPYFHWLNLMGALGVIISLLEDWNLPVFVLESVWALIAVYGLWQYYWRKRVQ